MVIIKLKTEGQTIYRKPQRKVGKLSEQSGPGATLLGWPKSTMFISRYFLEHYSFP